MQLHNLKRNTKRKKWQQIGRGGKRGKTSGHGGKGQTARAGAKVRPEIRDMIKRIPKLRGRGKNLNTSIQSVFAPVNVGSLDKFFEAGAVILPKDILRSGLISLKSGKSPRIKILGDGELTKALDISGCAFSKSAKSKIEKAGGKIA